MKVFIYIKSFELDGLLDFRSLTLMSNCVKCLINLSKNEHTLPITNKAESYFTILYHDFSM